MGFLDTACFGNKGCQQARDTDAALKAAQAAALSTIGQTKSSSGMSATVIIIIVVVVLLIIGGAFLLIRKKRS